MEELETEEYLSECKAEEAKEKLKEYAEKVCKIRVFLLKINKNKRMD